MKHLIEPLARVPGVRCALLVTPDGVPISVHADRNARRASNDVTSETEAAGDVAVLAALATGWTNEVQRATAPLSWGPPRRLVLRAARGTLCIVEAPGALLVAVLDSGTSADHLRLPMDATVARLQRHLRSIGAGPSNEFSNANPPGLFPARRSTAAGAEGSAGDEVNARSTGDPIPEPTGE